MSKKTRTQTQTNTIDPAMGRQANELYNLFRLVAGGGHQVNRGVTVAGFTPQQTQAFNMGNAATTAFGFGAPESSGLPATETSASGIEGYRPSVEYDESIAALPEAYRALMGTFYERAGRQTRYKEYDPDRGGGKKGGGKK